MERPSEQWTVINYNGHIMRAPMINEAVWLMLMMTLEDFEKRSADIEKAYTDMILYGQGSLFVW